MAGLCEDGNEPSDSLKAIGKARRKRLRGPDPDRSLPFDDFCSRQRGIKDLTGPKLIRKNLKGSNQVNGPAKVQVLFVQSNDLETISEDSLQYVVHYGPDNHHVDTTSSF
ncbi:hypothetical protein ANN_17512 [Periplaneta americana]|uniref:Uncharacterized protein n=1 Tax=Periplaneta americana TaxID=6978 RepID=A0ABQ8SV96_PERAM|nr:hypothetical protein ANN_17512 [Periplaneta americana]